MGKWGQQCSGWKGEGGGKRVREKESEGEGIIVLNSRDGLDCPYMLQNRKYLSLCRDCFVNIAVTEAHQRSI